MVRSDTSDTACPRCGGPALHPGVCPDRAGDVYPLYATLAEVWAERGRPPLSAAEIVAVQEAVRLAAAAEEPSAYGAQ